MTAFVKPRSSLMLFAALVAAAANAAAADAGAVVKVKVSSGTVAGNHTLMDDRTCTFTRNGGHVSFDGIFLRNDQFATNSKTTLHDIYVSAPSVLDSKHAGELSFKLVFAPTRKDARTGWEILAQHTIDTRPDSMLARYELDERGAGKLTGRGGIKVQKNATGDGPAAIVEFWGVTEQGVRIDVTIHCHRVDGNWHAGATTRGARIVR